MSEQQIPENETEEQRQQREQQEQEQQQQEQEQQEQGGSSEEIPEDELGTSSGGPESVEGATPRQRGPRG